MVLDKQSRLEKYETEVTRDEAKGKKRSVVFLERIVMKINNLYTLLKKP